MDSTSKFKRKKRKTRRTLNEIRTRLYNQTDKNYVIRYNSDCKLQKIKQKDNYVTANRLTLGLFHKIVRSETITRPDLAKINKSSFNENILDKKTYNNKESYLKNLECTNRSNNTPDKIKCMLENYQSSSQLDSPMLFSSIKSHKTTSHFGQQEILDCNTLTLPSKRPQSVNNHQIYEKFIQNLPKYIEENFPALLYGDAMKETKDYLRNLYLKNQCKTEGNILQCIHDNLYNENRHKSHTDGILSKTFFEDDPISYIKLGYVKHQEELKESPGLPNTRTGSDSPMSAMTLSTGCPPFIHDTPEYVYYPHKLNQ